MKCQKCGRNEVNFHYTSDVNGQVTQMHLCSVCASESGYDIENMFTDMFTGMFPMRNLMAIPVMQIGTGMPFATQLQTTRVNPVAQPCKCGCGVVAPDAAGIEVDEKMKKRRELNKQMRTAAQNEEFEEAARLRDKLKELDA